MFGGEEIKFKSTLEELFEQYKYVTEKHIAISENKENNIELAKDEYRKSLIKLYKIKDEFDNSIEKSISGKLIKIKRSYIALVSILENPNNEKNIIKITNAMNDISKLTISEEN